MNLSRLFKLGVAACPRTTFHSNRHQYSKVCFNLKKITHRNRYDNVNLPVRSVSTVAMKVLEKKESFINKIFNVNKSRIMASGYLLYEEVADKINYAQFFNELDLPDTFYSWFVITELHIWMISVRAMAEGDDGKMLRNYIIQALWADVNQRVKQLGAHNPSVARTQVAELSEQLQAALIAYDEGLQSDDTILAGALWRRFYQQEDVNPQCLELLVKYTRKQIRLLDHMSKEQIFTNKTIKWEPLKKENVGN